MSPKRIKISEKNSQVTLKKNKNIIIFFTHGLIHETPTLPPLPHIPYLLQGTREQCPLYSQLGRWCMILLNLCCVGRGNHSLLIGVPNEIRVHEEEVVVIWGRWHGGSGTGNERVKKMIGFYFILFLFI